MNIELKPDFEITDDACKAATGKTLTEWLDELEAKPELHDKRRDAIQWLYDGMGRGKDTWWSTTAWVEFQKRKGVVQKDGRPEGYNICSTKTIAAPVSTVYGAFVGDGVGSWLDAKAAADGSLSDANGNRGAATRVRPDKDLRYKWQTAGVETESDVDVAFAEKAGKTGITLTHNRIQTREESDGLRRAWAEAFDRLKAQLEGK